MPPNIKFQFYQAPHKLQRKCDKIIFMSVIKAGLSKLPRYKGLQRGGTERGESERICRRAFFLHLHAFSVSSGLWWHKNGPFGCCKRLFKSFDSSWDRLQIVNNMGCQKRGGGGGKPLLCRRVT